jgi:hypothetical protein
MDCSLALAYWRMRAEHELSYGDRQAGYRLLRQTEARSYQKEDLNNLGSIYADYGFARDAPRACRAGRPPLEPGGWVQRERGSRPCGPGWGGSPPQAPHGARRTGGPVRRAARHSSRWLEPVGWARLEPRSE